MPGLNVYKGNRLLTQTEDTSNEVRVVDLTHDGYGVVRVDNRVYFVDGVLPGELIRFRAGKKRKGRFEGYAEAIIQPSEQRIIPECAYFGVCGGCVLQHFDPVAQLAHKQKILFDNLARIGKVQAENVIAPIQGSVWQYRRKARLGVKQVPKKGGILVGFRERKSSFITSLMHCQTLDKRISDLLPGLHQLISRLSNNNRIPQVEVAAGDNRLALVFRHLEPFSAEDISCLQRYAQAVEIDLYLQPGGLDTVTPLSPESPRLLHYRLAEFDLELAFSPTDFTQVNAEVNQMMVSQAVGYLKPTATDNILDLFCGLGNFTLALGRSAAHVVGVDVEESLVQRGQANAKLNRMDNVSFQSFDLHSNQLLDEVNPLLNGKFNGRFNKMLLDPSRSGALEVVSHLVPKIKPELLVYVSCNPATLARDADIMVNTNGYTLTDAGVIDMFPHTAHVESMAVFRL